MKKIYACLALIIALWAFLYLASATGAPYDMVNGGAIRVEVRARVVDMESDFYDARDCDADTNEACLNAIEPAAEWTPEESAQERITNYRHTGIGTALQSEVKTLKIIAREALGGKDE